ncbi:MAG TPA: prephenate dehydratase domain-containing protein [Candidatus Limnocylindrales bacterium]|nr:prephenate dehydratase domain-containing protein [Candidatus Limnocylindrales bacterium]
MTRAETATQPPSDVLRKTEGSPLRTYAYLKPNGNFTHLAALELIKRPQHESAILIGESGIDNLFGSIISGRTSHALIPIENSTEGPVPKSHANLFEHDVTIVGEMNMPIIPSIYYQDKTTVKKVASKDSALGQCKQHIRKHFGSDVELIEMESTGDAVALAAKDPTVAAIGSSISAREQGIDNLHQIDNFNDKDLNATTFALVQKGGELPSPTGDDKTTFIMTIEDSKGKLVDALDVLAKKGVDLNKIKSINKTLDTVSFLVSADGHVDDEGPTGAALMALAESGVIVKKLGSYPKDDYAPPENNEDYDFDAAIERIQNEAKNGDEMDKNKTIVVFTLQDKPGALLGALKPFADEGVNLTKIDSQPSGIPNEHIFYLAFDNQTPRADELITELGKHCHHVAKLQRAA